MVLGGVKSTKEDLNNLEKSRKKISEKTLSDYGYTMSE